LKWGHIDVGFDLLDKKIQQILSKKGLTSPTPVQKETIKDILAEKSILAVSPTGSGKTEAAILPVMNFLLKNIEKRIFCLYITPLKALNRDILDRLLEIGTTLGIDIEVRHGDTPTSQRALQAKDPPHILITTPETFQAILVGKRMREHLKNIEFVIIDEIHELVGEKRGSQLFVGLERLKNLIGHDFTRIGLSATISEPERAARYLKGSSDKKPKIIDVKGEKRTKISLEWPVENDEDEEKCEDIGTTPATYARLRRVLELIKEKKSVLIFVNTRDTAEILGSRLKQLENKIGVHHSSLSRDSRLKTEKEFKKQELSAVVATSSLALGIDIGHIDLVIQYMSPRRVDSLTQRVGRAGHTLSRISEGKIIVVDPDDALEAAAVANFALSGILEPFEVETRPLDVLANQLTAMGFEGTYSPAAAFETVKRALYFENLTATEFQEVLDLLRNLRMLRLTENGLISIKKPAFGFFFSNLSMIKDSRKFEVVKIESKEKIAQVDEEFAAELELGSAFICRGLFWKVISREDNKIFVEEAKNAYNVPEWAGELMPVDYLVAQAVLKLRSDFRKEKGAYSGLWDENTLKFVEEDVEKTGGFKEDELGIECGPDFVVIRAFFGNKVNETLGRLLSSYLSLKYGDSVGLRTDAYRIFIKFPGSYSREFLEELLTSLDGDKIEPTLRVLLKNSPQFKQRFLQIAKKFGVISNDAVFSKISIQKLVDVYFGTAVFEETLAEYLQERMDLPRTREVIERLKDKQLKIRFIDGITRFSERLIDKYNPEVVFAGIPRSKIHDIIRKRLESKRFPLVCLSCKKWKSEVAVKNIDFACPSCGAKLIGYLRKENWSLLNKTGTLESREKKVLAQCRKTADLYLSYGPRAFFVLAGYGIGPETAARVLAKAGRKEEGDLIEEIIKAEKTYARTRIYWSDSLRS
jgi:ATP-dependent helicase Lhr and Lhr-like helicase